METSDTGLVISTTSQIEDRPVLEYLGIVSGEAAMSIRLATGRAAGMRRRMRPVATSIEHRVQDTRCRAIAKMVQLACELGATAIIGVNITYSTVHESQNGALLIVTASGTVVVL